MPRKKTAEQKQNEIAKKVNSIILDCENDLIRAIKQYQKQKKREELSAFFIRLKAIATAYTKQLDEYLARARRDPIVKEWLTENDGQALVVYWMNTLLHAKLLAENTAELSQVLTYEISEDKKTCSDKKFWFPLLKDKSRLISRLDKNGELVMTPSDLAPIIREAVTKGITKLQRWLPSQSRLPVYQLHKKVNGLWQWHTSLFNKLANLFHKQPKKVASPPVEDLNTILSEAELRVNKSAKSVKKDRYTSYLDLTDDTSNHISFKDKPQKKKHERHFPQKPPIKRKTLPSFSRKKKDFIYEPYHISAEELAKKQDVPTSNNRTLILRPNQSSENPDITLIIPYVDENNNQCQLELNPGALTRFKEDLVTFQQQFTENMDHLHHRVDQLEKEMKQWEKQEAEMWAKSEEERKKQDEDWKKQDEDRKKQDDEWEKEKNELLAKLIAQEEEQTKMHNELEARIKAQEEERKKNNSELEEKIDLMMKMLAQQGFNPDNTKAPEEIKLEIAEKTNIALPGECQAETAKDNQLDIVEDTQVKTRKRATSLLVSNESQPYTPGLFQPKRENSRHRRTQSESTLTASKQSFAGM
ncbi:MAG: hypothetical protein HKM04_05140 [Legionellales bacterium]|nr:hypothetical protein [Legionellales bacterium]